MIWSGVSEALDGTGGEILVHEPNLVLRARIHLIHSGKPSIRPFSSKLRCLIVIISILFGHPHTAAYAPKMSFRRHESMFLRVCIVVILLPLSRPLSMSEIHNNIPVLGSFPSSSPSAPSSAPRQHLYFLNVTRTAAQGRLTVLLKPSQGTHGLSLSVCPGRIPCAGEEGCECPRQWVDDGTRPGTGGSAQRAVDVSPCDLTNGLWYVAVDAPPPASGGGEGSQGSEGSQAYVVTAALDDARLTLGQSVEDVVCCLQSQYFTLDVEKWIKGNELVVRLISDTRLKDQSPLRLSASYERCGDDGPAHRLAPSMGQVLTVPPDKVRTG
eukprot:CAMPEP_0114109494 /NCGR_PEP_ID=MMETSP0043_2-20121206/807_1 /TAXON_ID=464988 /ORGANISM="Hemiselmis andersenii, Strain CCMP644" /LENGTH=325 /DNA_ID=CAMNT_0001201377 /DNA_START=8 /DNA_END=983 /DNA_ORIENTATION=+